MTAISRRGQFCPISNEVTLATADDLNGTNDNTQAYNITGADRVIISQISNGSAGTAGIDCIEISHDDGQTWKPDATTGLLATANDNTGTIIVDGVLNVAGVEPTTLSGVFKFGPYEGPTWIRCGRLTSTITSMTTYDHTLTGGTTWVGGAPSVFMVAIGLSGALALAGA